MQSLLTVLFHLVLLKTITLFSISFMKVIQKIQVIAFSFTYYETWSMRSEYKYIYHISNQ